MGWKQKRDKLNKNRQRVQSKFKANKAKLSKGSTSTSTTKSGNWVKDTLGGFFNKMFAPAVQAGDEMAKNFSDNLYPKQSRLDKQLSYITNTHPYQTNQVHISAEKGLKHIGQWDSLSPGVQKIIGKMNIPVMNVPRKLKIGEEGYRVGGFRGKGLPSEDIETLEWIAKQNPTGMTKKDAKKLYANQIAEGLTLEQAMDHNPAETMSYYALLEDEPTKNESLKVNNTKENKNMAMGPLITSAAKAAIPLTVGSKKKTYKSNATTADQKRLDTLYQKHFDRSGDHTTKGGASYWIDEHKPKTQADWDNIDRMLGASAEAKSPGNLGGVSRDSSTMFQGDKGQEYLDSFRGDGSLVGLNSANTLNQIAANTGQTGGYFQQSDQGIIDRIDKAVNSPVTTQPIIEDPKPVTPEPGKEKGGMDDFMKFLMLMSVMGGGRGGGGGYGGSQFGYGGLNPGGVQDAYNPLESLKGMGDWFKTNFGSGVSGGSGLDVAKT